MKNYILIERNNLYEPNVYINFIVHIEGEPSIEDLVIAVRTAYTANEVTMSRVVLEEGGRAFYERMNESGCKVIVTDKNWEELIKENEIIPFDIEHGEFIRTFVISSGSDISLLFMGHHLVGDGKSIAYFIQDVMNGLSGRSLDFTPLQLIGKESLPKDSNLPMGIKLYVNRFNRRWKRSGCNFTWKDYSNIHNKYWNTHSSKFIYKTFTKEELIKMKANAKKIGVSLNSYIVTGFLEANRKNKSVGIPIDIRINANRSMSNQTSGTKVVYIYSDRKSFKDNTKEVHDKIYKKLNHPVKKYFVLNFISLFEPTLLDSVLLCTYGLYRNKVSKKLAKVMGYSGGKTRDLGITNLTKLEIPHEYKQYKIKSIIFIPPVVTYVRRVIGVVTIGDIMTITYHFMSNQNEVEEKNFFERGINNITSELMG